MKYQWLLFDADDTLFDYIKAERAALKKTFADFGEKFTQHLLDRYRQINSGLFKDLEEGLVTSTELRTKRFERIFEEFGIQLDVGTFSETYLKNLSQQSTLIEGALETTRHLSNSCKMLLVTNGLAEVQRPRFGNSEIKRYFEGMIISDEIGVAKPSVEFFDIAFEEMGSPDKEDVLIVGDSLTSDMAGGINYGIDTCWYNPGNVTNGNELDVTYEIRKLSDLLTLIAF